MMSHISRTQYNEVLSGWGEGWEEVRVEHVQREYLYSEVLCLGAFLYTGAPCLGGGGFLYSEMRCSGGGKLGLGQWAPSL